MNDSRLFDSCVDLSYPQSECIKVIEHYFDDDKLNNKNILDIGCRTGDFTFAFSKKGASVVGLDISTKSIEVARKKYPELRNNFIIADIQDECFLDKNTSKFNVAFCLGVFPYFSDNQGIRTLKNIYNLLNDDGLLLVMFQKEKHFLIKIFVLIFNFIPFPIYEKFVSRLLAYLISLFLKVFLKKNISKEYLHYGVLLGIRGIRFGIPKFIPQQNKVVTANSIAIHKKTSESFCLSKSDILKILNQRRSC